jgi:hypothetical protein
MPHFQSSDPTTTRTVTVPITLRGDIRPRYIFPNVTTFDFLRQILCPSWMIIGFRRSAAAWPNLTTIKTDVPGCGGTCWNPR